MENVKMELESLPYKDGEMESLQKVRQISFLLVSLPPV